MLYVPFNYTKAATSFRLQPVISSHAQAMFHVEPVATPIGKYQQIILKVLHETYERIQAD